MSTIEFDTPDAVWISRALYCKTPEALELVLAKLREIGYEIQDERVDGYSVKEGRTTPEQMEQNGWSLWYASLDLHRAKCGSCNAYITTLGCRMHDATCTECGAVIYREIVDGSTIRFEFRDDSSRAMFGPELKLRAKRWDAVEGYLYLYTEFLEGGLCVVTGERATIYMAQHADKWERVVEDGVELFKIRYAKSNGIYLPVDWVISPAEIYGHEWNHKIVNVWQGKEYPEYGSELPVPDSISIYEAWHWAPLPASPTLHRRVLSAIGNTDDKGWHYQDGRPWFTARSWREAGKFVRHFTELDAEAWDIQSMRFRLDGPGGIDDVAAFCHPDAVAENRPNIGNTLVAFGKALSGERLTATEIEAAKVGVADDPVHGMHGRRNRRR